LSGEAHGERVELKEESGVSIESVSEEPERDVESESGKKTGRDGDSGVEDGFAVI
jgi:hypothetical protein